jgi:hypothetical protein
MRARWLAAVVAVSAIALADPQDASELAARAEASAKAGDFLGAAALYRDAFRASGKLEHECNVGVAFYKAKDLPRAHLYLARCLAQATQLPQAFVQQLRTVIAAVDGKLAAGPYGEINLSLGDATVQLDTFDPLDTITTPARFWVLAGKRHLTMRKPGFHDSEHDIDVVAGKVSELAIQLEPIPHEAPPPDAAVASDAPLPAIDAAPAVITPPVAIAQPSYRSVWIAGGAAAVFGLFAAGSYWIGSGVARDAGMLPAGSAYDNKKTTAELWQYAEGVNIGAAIVAAGIAVYLYVHAGQHVVVAPRPDGAAVVWHF